MDNLLYNAVAPWQGYFHWLGNIREGEGKNGHYAFADFTLMYRDHKMQEQYITFSTGNADHVELLKGLQQGTPLRVSWAPASAYDNNRDRWYPSLKCWGVMVIKQDAQQAPQQQTQAPAPAPVQSAGYAPMPQARQQDAWKNPMDSSQFAQSNYTPSDADLPF